TAHGGTEDTENNTEKLKAPIAI
ncbi:MAG: hypothetical protein JWO06_2026, partial [Bacteroidota bacterium]|nr:hypothetical protein [Bacteroidota bacterium]